MTGNRVSHGHSIKCHIEGAPHRRRPVKSGWKKVNKEKARARRIARTEVNS